MVAEIFATVTCIIV